ncbi:Zn-finger in Ran binding protein and others, putative [Angomonas deanei]|uniref:Zn-finger in Ran binding protein and others, putative n=1 Tax=Angomonas deanei TaxID=59799 RepID=A0A7G2C369_9TRYP|nr:Zn-finger in Ran binding protein and others, putative [Angomonas deanei]
MGGGATKPATSAPRQRKSSTAPTTQAYNAKPSQTPNPLRNDSTPSGWTCSKCTLKNPGHLTACEVCGASKDTQKGKKNSREQGAALGNEAPGNYDYGFPLVAQETSACYGGGNVGYSMVPAARLSDGAPPYPVKESTVRRAKTLKSKQWEYVALLVSTTKRAKQKQNGNSGIYDADYDEKDDDEVDEMIDGYLDDNMSVCDDKGEQLLQPTMSMLVTTIYDHEEEDEVTNVMSGEYAPETADAGDQKKYYSVFNRDEKPEENKFDPVEYERRRQKILSQLEYLKQQQKQYHKQSTVNAARYKPPSSRFPPPPTNVRGATIPFVPQHPVPSPQPNPRMPVMAAPKVESDMSHMITFTYSDIRMVNSPVRSRQPRF